MHYCYLSTPIGELLLAADAGELAHVGLPTAGAPATPEADWRADRSALAGARRQLDEYFSGQRVAFDLPLRLPGTAFQRQVLVALREIPYGQTASYGDIARRIGRPRAVRAVGAANRRNPLPIVIPCHRVIGADGSLTGYAGGLPLKAALLSRERAGAPAAANPTAASRWGPRAGEPLRLHCGAGVIAKRP